MTAMDFRQYDNALGRFHGVDLLAEIDYSGSPYSFSFNNPVFFSDPSGLTPQEGEQEPPKLNGIVLDEVDIVKPPKKNTGSPFMDMSFAPLISSAGGLGFGIIGNNGSGVGAIGIGPYSIAGHVPLSTNLEIVSSAELKNMVSVKQSSNKQTWDTNGDGILQKREADSWYLYGRGISITVDNSKIDWSGLKRPLSTRIGDEFTVQTHTAFFDLPFETASTYGGTPFIRTSLKTAIIVDQEYHYRLRPNNNIKDIFRNFLNEMGKPGGTHYGQGYNLNPPRAEGQAFIIHFINPVIRFK
jgi:hypothetical protein